MSWSFGMTGKPQVLVAKLDVLAATNPCRQPEEAVRQQALAIIKSALEASDQEQVVSVRASGSESYRDYQAQSGRAESLHIEVAPVFDFVP